MSDQQVENLTHGFNINGGEHAHALSYMGSHMSEQQVKEMVHRAESGHSAHFEVVHNGEKSDFKLEHHNGKLEIHHVHHGF